MPYFVRYDEAVASHGHNGGPTITATARGVITLNAAAVEAIHAPSHVALLWDNEARTLGIQPVSEADSGAVRLMAMRNTSGSRDINRKPFLEWAGIDYTTARRWAAFLDEEVLCADLSELGTAVTSNRAKKPARLSCGR